MPERDSVGIQIKLKRINVTQTQIAEDAGVHKTTVTHTIKGDRNNKKVLAALKAVGVPARYLG